MACLLTARFLLQLRELQSKETVSDGMTSRAMDGPQQTLSELRGVGVVDAVLLDDFGDVSYPSTQTTRQTESTQAMELEGYERGNNKELEGVTM